MTKEQLEKLYIRIRILQTDASEFAVKLQDVENELDLELSKLPQEENEF